MNTNFNYSGFIDMFIESNDEFEPYGVISESLELIEPDTKPTSAEKYMSSKAILPTLA